MTSRNALRYAITVSSALMLKPAAAEPSFSASYSACMDASGGITSEMMDCSGAEIDAQDAELNRLWSAIQKKLEPDAMTSLRKAQRAWIAYRDAQCDSDAVLSGGGSLAAVIYSGCILTFTAERVEALTRIVQSDN